MTSQFSPKVSEILAFSREEASRLASRSVGPEHLLLGILRERDGIIPDLFSSFEINIQDIKKELEYKAKEDEIQEPIITSELVLNQQASNILKLSVLEARVQHTQIVDIQHLLLALLHDQTNNGAKQVLEENNMNYEDTLSYLKKITSTPIEDGLQIPDEEDEEDDSMMTNNMSSQNSKNTTTTEKRSKSNTPVLDNFSIDLTAAAQEDTLLYLTISLLT